MTFGIVLLAVSLLMMLIGLTCWFTGVQLGFLAKFSAGILVFCLCGSGIFLVSREWLSSDSKPDSVEQEVSPPTPPEPISDPARQRLVGAHDQTVRVFIGRLGFGQGRMVMFPDIRDVVNASQSTSPAEHTVGFRFGKGESKSTNIHPSMNKFLRIWETDDNPADTTLTRWDMVNVKLIGLSKNPTPVVYLTDRVPNMDEAKTSPTRELDEFERTAVEKLRVGEDIHIENQGKKIRMVGPLFAGASCVTCHENRGQMLGAFTYEIERATVAKPK